MTSRTPTRVQLGAAAVASLRKHRQVSKADVLVAGMGVVPDGDVLELKRGEG